MKKILFQSDFALIKSGFGRSAKAVLSFLFKTGKYEIVHYCVGVSEDASDLNKTPWKSIGCLPSSDEKLEFISKDPKIKILASYGAYYLDEVIRKEKPDVYIAAQDIWGVDFAIGKPWFNRINSVIWTTIDSLPVLPTAVVAAKKCKNYWIWSNFATKAFHNLGHAHVKTVHGPIEDKFFFKLSEEERLKIRKENNIAENCFVVGFVFRNQPRKSVPNLLNGFKKFKKLNPNLNTKLLLHTSFQEGWNIHQLCDGIGIDKSDILTTIICSNCKRYEVKPYSGSDKLCKYCEVEKSCNTTSVVLGIDESSLNEIYNLMDVYCHPFTSGGQEIPIQEAKLTELITLVTNYSCGEEMCEQEAKSLPLEWSEYREMDTQFIKASTSPDSICDQLNLVLAMTPDQRKKMGEEARKWAIDNFSIAVVGKQIEDFIDSSSYVDKNIFNEIDQKDPSAIIKEIEDPKEWIKELYSSILKITVTNDDEGLLHWEKKIQEGGTRDSIENYFRRIALRENKDNNEKKENKFDFLLDDEKRKKILYILPKNQADIYSATSLFKSIKSKYRNHALYVAIDKENRLMVIFNKYIDKIIDDRKEKLETKDFLEKNKEKKYFEIIFAPHLLNESILNFESYE